MYIWVHPWLTQDVCELLNVSSIAGTKHQKSLLILSLEKNNTILIYNYDIAVIQL